MVTVRAGAGHTHPAGRFNDGDTRTKLWRGENPDSTANGSLVDLGYHEQSSRLELRPSTANSGGASATEATAPMMIRKRADRAETG